MNSAPLRILALALLALPACSTPRSTSPDLRRKAASTPIVEPEALSGRAHRVLGEVVGVSCAVQAGSNPSESGARSEMRLNAVELGADAVGNVFCEEGGLDMGKNCFKKIECRGDAIAWE